MRLEFPKRHPFTMHWELKPVQPLPAVATSPASSTRIPFDVRAAFHKGEVILGSIVLGTNDLFTNTLPTGSPLQLKLRSTVRLEKPEQLHHWVVFLHLLDQNDQQVFARDIRLEAIPDSTSSRDLIWNLGPLSLPPGDYQVGIGLYDQATEVRFSPDLIHANRLPDQRAGVATLTVTP